MDRIGIPLEPRACLIDNEHYMRHIFHKSEKITQAVFYISQFFNDTYIKDKVRTAAEQLLACTHTGLLTDPRTLNTREIETRACVLLLESALGLAAASGELGEEHYSVFRSELDVLVRGFRVSPTLPAPRSLKKTQTSIKKLNLSSSNVKDTLSGISRKEHILSLIKDTPQCAIKDISHHFPALSEKTIQRDLIELITDGKVRKDGERRWARYSVVS